MPACYETDDGANDKTRNSDEERDERRDEERDELMERTQVQEKRAGRRYPASLPACLTARSPMPCGSQCHRISPRMLSDVIIDTASCLPYRPSSRIRPVIISYRIPDDIDTQSITCDTGYDHIRFLSAISPPHLIALQLPAPLPAAPCRPTGRLEARCHPARYSLARLACLLISFHLIGSSHRLIRFARCLLALSAARRRHPPSAPYGSSISSISSAPPHLIGFISRPAPLPALLPAGRPAPPLLARLVHLIHLIHLIRFAPSHWLIALPHRMRRATSRRNGARDGQSITVKRNATTSDASQIPQTPLLACRIAPTSRTTHGHQHEHAHDKTPPL